jgi:sporulation protein YlmC with PRC-barrel domain
MKLFGTSTDLEYKIMNQIFARNLRDKQVVSSDGVTLGVLNNIVIDIRSGSIENLVVKPDIGLEKAKFKEDGEFILMPFDSVRAIKDYIVVDKTMSFATAAEPPATET